MTGNISRHYLFRMALMLIIVSAALSLPVVLAHLIPYVGPVIHRGLPVGLQSVTPRGSDARTLAVAAEFEATSGHS